ncbi:hypothetical protein BH23CHL5_BH23CHL5_28490 [soil metagenome]
MFEVPLSRHGPSELPSHGQAVLTWIAPDAFNETYNFNIGASFPKLPATVVIGSQNQLNLNALLRATRASFHGIRQMSTSMT